MRDELFRIAKGEILDDTWSRQIYSVDASYYTITPLAVAYPLDAQDVQLICEYSFSRKIPITARGAGTGLLGQSLSNGIVLDFTKHMNTITEIGDDYVVVQPGVVKGILDKELSKKNKFLPPDPASSNYCTIGGMIANNSSGVHCLGYGNTIDFLDQVCVIYPNGKLGVASAKEHDDLMSKLLQLLLPYHEIIQKGYPRVSKNSCGYRLDAVLAQDKFLPHKLFAASEGTLGLISSAKLRIVDIPEYRCMMVLAFEDILEAVSAVPTILKASPTALEMLDHTAVSFGQHKKKDEDAGCILFVEFMGNSSEIEERMAQCQHALEGKCTVLEYASDSQSILKIWQARKGALNNIMKMTVGSRRPIGLIEDTVVHPSLLADHVSSMLQTYRKNKLDYVMYGHVGDGNIHTRPIVNIDSESEIELITRIAGNIFANVIDSGGTITGEHGDGLARVAYIEMMYGNSLTALFSIIKRLFDPGFMLNPGKKVPIQQ